MISKNQYKYSREIQYYNQTWLLCEYISMKHGISDTPEHFSMERKVMRGINTLHAYGYVSEYGFNKQSYLRSPYDQQRFQVQIKANKFINSSENNLDGDFIFVLTCDVPPKLLCCKDGEYLHSYMANGKKLLGAGSLTFKEGVLIGISNNSGHYRPTDEEMLRVIKALYLASAGSLKSYISFSDVVIKNFSVGQLIKCNSFSEAAPIQNVPGEHIERRFNKQLTAQSWANLINLYGILQRIKNEDVVVNLNEQRGKEPDAGYSDSYTPV